VRSYDRRVATGRRAAAYLLAGIAALSLALAGCSDNEDAEGASTTVTGGSGEDRGSQGADRRPPKDQSLDLEQRHANGVVVRVTGIRFAQNSMTVSLEAFNGYREEVKLNRFDAALVDNLDQEYRFSPPAENPELTVRPNETLRGALAFVGVPGRQATSLRLVINALTPATATVPKPDPGYQVDTYTHPKFVFEGIPVSR
jgi:hypothetical protein